MSARFFRACAAALAIALTGAAHAQKPSAAEEFHLRGECHQLGQKLADFILRASTARGKVTHLARITTRAKIGAMCSFKRDRAIVARSLA